MRERNQTVDALRGIAALWVCLFHFTAATGVGTYGYLGVTMFFVISGFIVPYSMVRAGYTIAALPTFLAKRLVRLEPPYLVSIGIILALGAWDAFRGSPPTWTAAQIAGHIGYANALLGLPWLNAPYWSLAIEFQFYLLMAVALPLLTLARTPAQRLAGVALAASLPLLLPGHNNATIFPFLPVFAAGILCFLRATNMIGRNTYWAALAILTGLVCKTHDIGVAIATTGTAILIAAVRIGAIAPLAWFGAISYSLYLLHVPIGYRVIAAIRQSSGGEPGHIIGILGALAVSVASAALLRRYVELPALRLAARIGYRGASVRSSLLADPP